MARRTAEKTEVSAGTFKFINFINFIKFIKFAECCYAKKGTSVLHGAERSRRPKVSADSDLESENSNRRQVSAVVFILRGGSRRLA